MVKNYVLRAKENKMTPQLVKKVGISGIIKKSVVLSNQDCLPFVYGLTADNYSFEK
jgi:hypothetical protein